VRQCLHSAPQAAVAWVEHEVRRLLSGGCELWELVMTVRWLLRSSAQRCCLPLAEFHRCARHH
jgi:hypothetical protein